MICKHVAGRRMVDYEHTCKVRSFAVEIEDTTLNFCILHLGIAKLDFWSDIAALE